MTIRYTDSASGGGRTLTAGYGIVVTNGGGESANPVISKIGLNEVITFSATITPNFAFDNHFVLLTGNFTLANPTNKTNLTNGEFVLTQDGTGSRLLSAKGTNWLFPGGLPVLSTGANAADRIKYTVQSSGLIYATLEKAFS